MGITKRSGPSDSSWEEHKAFIERYYIRDDLSLREVAKLMRTEYNFDAQPHMYKSRFKKWNFQKYNRDVVIQAIVRKLIQRDNEGKSTVIHLHGKEITRFEVMRYLNRKGIKDLNEAFTSGKLVPSETPIGLQLVTPPLSLGLHSASELIDEPDAFIPTGDDHHLDDFGYLNLPDEIDLFLYSSVLPGDNVLNLDLLQNVIPQFALGPAPPTAIQRPTTPIQEYNPNKERSPWSELLTDPLPHGKVPGRTLMIFQNLQNTLDVNSADSTFGNTPLHDALLNASSPVNHQMSRALIETITALVSRGASTDQPNKAGITPKELALSLSLNYEFERGVHGETALSAVSRPPLALTARQRRWLEDYSHYAALGCLPATCQSEECQWWNAHFRNEQLALINPMLGEPISRKRFADMMLAS